MCQELGTSLVFYIYDSPISPATLATQAPTAFAQEKKGGRINSSTVSGLDDV